MRWLVVSEGWIGLGEMTWSSERRRFRQAESLEIRASVGRSHQNHGIDNEGGHNDGLGVKYVYSGMEGWYS